MIQSTVNYDKFTYDKNSIDEEILQELEFDKIYNETVIVNESFKVLKRPETLILAEKYKKPVNYVVYKDLSDEYILNLYSDNAFYEMISMVKKNTQLSARLIAFCLKNCFSYNTFLSNEFYAGEIALDTNSIETNFQYYSNIFSFIKNIKDNLKLSSDEIEKIFFNFTSFTTTLFSIQQLENLKPTSLEEVMEINEYVVSEGMKSALQMLHFWSIVQLPKLQKLKLMQVEDLDKKEDELIKNSELNKLLLATTETNYDELIDKALDQQDKDFFDLIAAIKSLKEKELENQ